MNVDNLRKGSICIVFTEKGNMACISYKLSRKLTNQVERFIITHDKTFCKCPQYNNQMEYCWKVTSTNLSRVHIMNVWMSLPVGRDTVSKKQCKAFDRERDVCGGGGMEAVI